MHAPQVTQNSLFLSVHSNIRDSICQQLDGRSFARLNLVCRDLRNYVKTAKALWQRLFMRETGGYCPTDHLTGNPAENWKSLYIRKELIKRNFRCNNLEPYVFTFRAPMLSTICNDQVYGSEFPYTGLTHYHPPRAKTFYVPGSEKKEQDIIRIDYLTQNLFKTQLADVVTFWNGKIVLHSREVKDYDVMECMLKTERFGKRLFPLYVLYSKNDFTHTQGQLIDSKDPFVDYHFKRPHQPVIMYQELVWFIYPTSHSLVAYDLNKRDKKRTIRLPVRFKFADPLKKITHFAETPYCILQDANNKVWVINLENNRVRRIRKCRHFAIREAFLYGKSKSTRALDTIFRWDLTTVAIDKKYAISEPVKDFSVEGNRILIKGENSASIYDIQTEEKLMTLGCPGGLRDALVSSSGILYVSFGGMTDCWDMGSKKKMGSLKTSQLSMVYDGHIMGCFNEKNAYITFYYNLVKPLPKKDLLQAFAVKENVTQWFGKSFVELHGTQ